MELTNGRNKEEGSDCNFSIFLSNSMHTIPNKKGAIGKDEPENHQNGWRVAEKGLTKLVRWLPVVYKNQIVRWSWWRQGERRRILVKSHQICAKDDRVKKDVGSCRLPKLVALHRGGRVKITNEPDSGQIEIGLNSPGSFSRSNRDRIENFQFNLEPRSDRLEIESLIALDPDVFQVMSRSELTRFEFDQLTSLPFIRRANPFCDYKFHWAKHIVEVSCAIGEFRAGMWLHKSTAFCLIGKGCWKAILSRYPDVFEERTEIASERSECSRYYPDDKAIGKQMFVRPLLAKITINIVYIPTLEYLWDVT
ncbi:hypothetical protein AXF42_Ash003727 [Apostasia shenzhenica]|uniref:Uncharacterized protein n=1 Tax=Apostasia shenzhenica TaxID=1088818 RepID=A0A2I0AHS1_9ASPA|nr:hypothetical protein AXF42_Ash003727 [Apostasia shenzhenica]